MHKASFNGFQYWNHDAVPTKTDPLRKCVDWLELSKHVSFEHSHSAQCKQPAGHDPALRAQLHQPVTAEEVQQQIQQRQL